MKVVILCGGRGTRISEETRTIPKPLTQIGDRPILWHIMKIYSHYGFNEFILCLGYLGYIIKDYFSHYFLHMSDVTLDMISNDTQIHSTVISEPWRVTLVDTGLLTATGGRLKRVKKFIGNETFMFTYGDGVADINIKELLEFHKRHGKLATITAVQPLGRFGALDLGEKDKVLSFQEKPKGDNAWINGGFFVLEPKVLDYIEADTTPWESTPAQNLAKEGQFVAYKHHGFWQPLDTLREKLELESLWNSGCAPWKVWKD
jgi:glucose-1-phosphate cytidylyltransferase